MPPSNQYSEAADHTPLLNLSGRCTTGGHIGARTGDSSPKKMRYGSIMRHEALTTPATAPITNPTIATQLAHRSIRAFSDEPLTEDQITTLYEVARHTATCTYAQQFTIIRVTDPVIRHEVYLASGQPYVDGPNAELFVFVVDLYRNAAIRAEAGIDDAPLARTNVFFSGFYDTMLAAQNMVLAAESMGLGTVYLASIQGDPRRVITALNLPKFTYPAVGLLVGHAAQDPQFKPRLPLTVTTAENTYPEIESYKAHLADYDAKVQEYYDLRDANNRIDSFTHQIEANLGKGAAMTSPMLEILHEQGLLLE